MKPFQFSHEPLGWIIELGCELKYSDDDQGTKVSQAVKMLETANALAPELNMEVGDIYQGLLKLQTNAVDKLSARDLLAKSNQLDKQNSSEKCHSIHLCKHHI